LTPRLPQVLLLFVPRLQLRVLPALVDWITRAS